MTDERTKQLNLDHIRKDTDEEYNAGELGGHLQRHLYTLCAEVERLRKENIALGVINKVLGEERDDLRQRLDDYRNDLHRHFLDFRGIDPEYGGALVCTPCRGSGVRAYGSTATWHGGIGGQAITSDVCDKCWGSGDLNRKGADLRALTGELRNLRKLHKEN